MKYYAHKGLTPLQADTFENTESLFINTHGWGIVLTPMEIYERVIETWGEISCRIYEYDVWDDITTFRLILEIE